jgi:CDP-6-deoxy-D-xylo-4-hexulose-3-dehydrase
VFSGNIIRHPGFQNIKHRVCGDLKNTDIVTENTFWIGVYPGLSQEMIEFILGEFDAFLKAY